MEFTRQLRMYMGNSHSALNSMVGRPPMSAPTRSSAYPAGTEGYKDRVYVSPKDRPDSLVADL
jgi:hypothetical protein